MELLRNEQVNEGQPAGKVHNTSIKIGKTAFSKTKKMYIAGYGHQDEA